MRIHLAIGLTLLVVSACAEEPTPATTATPTAPAAPHAPADDAERASQVPGLPLAFAREVVPGIVSGGQPDVAALQAAKQAGYRTVISLRAPGEPGFDLAAEQAQVQAHGMRFVSIPVSGAEGLTKDNAQALANALGPDSMPAIVHCGTGNRVGALFALKARLIDGQSPEAALALGKKAGLGKLEAAVTGLVQAPN